MAKKSAKLSKNKVRSGTPKRRGLSASRAGHELEELNRIGIAETHEVDQLLGMILKKAREITSADAGSLYLEERADGESRLRFKLTQNDSVEFPFTELAS